MPDGKWGAVMALLFRCRVDQNVYAGTTGTTPATNGAAVGSWAPYEGLITTRLLHATKGPTYRANDNSSGLPGLEWSAGKLLAMAHSSSWVGMTSFSWLMCLRNVTATSSQYRYLWSRALGWTKAGCRLNAGASTDDLFTFHDSNYNPATHRNISTPRPTEASGTRYVVAGTATGTNTKLYVNRQTVVSKLRSQSIDLGTSSLTVGEDGDGSGTYNLAQGVLYEIAFFNSALTDAEMASEIDAVMSRWSVANTVEPPASSGGTIMPGHIFSNVMVS